MNERAQEIERRLRDTLKPESLEIIDESHLHAGHAGAKGGAGHYVVTIVADAFRNLNTMSRHRLVYTALGDMMPREIHALSIKAFDPDEI
ncbi:MAG: BolA family transcriptional regulator [Gammaproteobacteria bacterium]|nr:BolA family transcriptional regulator [Gammaproteobacteria bacterium]